MSAEQTDALVLRVIAWSETSCIATLFTRDFGKISVLAKGARRPKSPFEAALDLLCLCRVVFIPKAGDALDLLTEAKLARRFRAASHDLMRLYAGYYVAELLERMTDRDDRHAEVFQLADATLSDIDHGRPLSAIVLRWELQLLRMLGNLPSWDRCAQCGLTVDVNETTVFGPLAGGVLCSACRIGQRQMIEMPSDVLLGIRKFSNPQWQSLDLNQYPHTGRRTIRAVMERYLTALLDRKLNMHPYLEELGR